MSLFDLKLVLLVLKFVSFFFGYMGPKCPESLCLFFFGMVYGLINLYFEFFFPILLIHISKMAVEIDVMYFDERLKLTLFGFALLSICLILCVLLTWIMF